MPGLSAGTMRGREHGRGTPRRDAQHREILWPRPCAAQRQSDGPQGRDRRPSGRQWRGQVYPHQGAFGRCALYLGRNPDQVAARSDLRSTNDAINAGIETIYQDLALVPQLSISRNLFLGRELRKGPGILGPAGHGPDERGCCRPAEARRHFQEHPADNADRFAFRRRAAGRGNRARHVFRQRADHPRRAHQQPWRRRNAGRPALRARGARHAGIPASSSRTTSTMSFRWSTAWSSCGAARWWPTT